MGHVADGRRSLRSAVLCLCRRSDNVRWPSWRIDLCALGGWTAVYPFGHVLSCSEGFHLLGRFDLLATDDGTSLAFLVVQAVEVCCPPLRRRLAVLAATGRSIRSAR